ncbi:MAG: tRNA (adenosine(37)-N6)-threonylcarbamoyltransferase complex ATPase subunit type 1 TsaE [Rhodospirillaceae bacterium]|nr:tRNA (adenosine(37)-N6)-threonylcarbamoyltransferase complex ATPase subunit type 1 TsaE [Rhodospirillaceae bacterium]
MTTQDTAPPCPHVAGPDDWEWRFTLGSPEDTATLAEHVGDLTDAGDVLALWGDLGVGKSAFARALIRAQTSAEEDVPSPTFTLVQIYEPTADAPIWHFDLYRLNGPEDIWELGFDDALEDAVSLIEWPERLGRQLPLRRLDVELVFAPEISPTARHIRLIGRGPDWARRVERLSLERGETSGD